MDYALKGTDPLGLIVHSDADWASEVFDDNQGAIALARNSVNRQRCKHIDDKSLI